MVVKVNDRYFLSSREKYLVEDDKLYKTRLENKGPEIEYDWIMSYYFDPIRDFDKSLKEINSLGYRQLI